MRGWTTYSSTEVALPCSTGSGLWPPASLPPWAQAEPFLRAAFHPDFGLVTERFDPNDHPQPCNYNHYEVSASTGGVALSPPNQTPSTFIKHHSSTPSTWFDDQI